MRRIVLIGVLLAALCLQGWPVAAQEVSPEAAESFVKAKTLLAENKVDEALKELQTTLTLAPKLYLANFLRGIIYEGRGQYDLAIADYTRAIEIQPFSGAHVQRARCYMLKGQAPQALADFARAEALKPDDGDIYLNRALLYFSLKHYDKARQDAAKAQTLGKKVPEEFLRRLKEASGTSPRPPQGAVPPAGSESLEGLRPAPQPAPAPPPAPAPGPETATGPAQEELPGLIKRSLPGVATIYAYDISDNLVGNGSGFFINNHGHLVTNFHVLANKTRARVKVGQKFYPLKGIVAANRKWDLALAQVDAPQGSYAVLPLARKAPEVGEHILVLGSPLGLEQSASEGIVAAIRVNPNPDFDKISVLQLTAAISSGNSGGPVLNRQGEVVGVVSFQRTGGQNLNFAIPIHYVRQLPAGPVKPLAPALMDQETRKALACYEQGKKFYDAGKYQEALTAFSLAVKLYADFARAYNYLGLTYRKLNRYKQAEDAYFKAVRLNPQNSVYLYNLGMLYYQAEHYQDARQAFEMALKLAPKDADVHFMLGKACVQLKDRVAAARHYELLKKLNARQAQELSRLINR